MKNVFSLILICTAMIAKADFWTQKANFTGPARSGAFAFSIDGKGYVGCGRDNPTTLLNDFWEYNPSTNSWTQKANFGGPARMFCSAFAVSGKGYAGLGKDVSSSVVTDFWEYTPSSNSWAPIANFPGVARYNATGISGNQKGYIACGTDAGFSTYFNDLWEYNPPANLWTQKFNLAGAARSDGGGFFIEEKLYLVCGYDGTFLSDCWQYDLASNAWTQKANKPGSSVIDASSFAICGKGYSGIGQSSLSTGGNPDNNLYRYDPGLNQWVQKAAFGGAARDEVSTFVIGSKAYVGFGGPNGSPFNIDLWEYTPDSACITATTELESPQLVLDIYPNPATESIVIKHNSSGEETKLCITNAEGKIVFTEQMKSSNSLFQRKINISHLARGTYFVQLDNGRQKVIRKFLKE